MSDAIPFTGATEDRTAGQVTEQTFLAGLDVEITASSSAAIDRAEYAGRLRQTAVTRGQSSACRALMREERLERGARERTAMMAWVANGGTDVDTSLGERERRRAWLGCSRAFRSSRTGLDHRGRCRSTWFHRGGAARDITVGSRVRGMLPFAYVVGTQEYSRERGVENANRRVTKKGSRRCSRWKET